MMQKLFGEIVNWRFKQFNCLKNVWRHDLAKHKMTFCSIAVQVQLGLQYKSLEIQVIDITLRSCLKHNNNVFGLINICFTNNQGKSKIISI